ncbi:MAG: fibronectin type III domain-containing protein, partial [Desulfuromonadales bacterium]|nr:fibronectin type III domain-containing protein [Desulfuromonadales bacterium]
MKSFQILIISFLILVNSISIAFCQDITLSWDPSPTPEVIGYKVYYKQGNMDFPFDGTGAYEGASPVDVGDVLSTTLTGLTDGVTYFFSVTAYDNDDSESSYSNIVSNSWLPSLVIPTDGATNEPVPVTFQWETAPAGYDVTYTLYYGTDQNEVTTAGSIVTLPPVSGSNGIPPAAIIVLVALMMIGITYRSFPRIKFLPQAVSLLLVVLLGGMLT